MGNVIYVDFNEKVTKNNTTIWYETLVFDISRMLKYYTENEIYAHLEKNEQYAPDTLHYAIDEAKELVK
ncbi:hypothetical protein CN376_23000 [Bacillus cereus]|uniref:hypothetical protein n=1 Tax=Bacillus cereus TaxID=1396 RepID=UPI000BF7C6C6|nr:hypothetical protein [Bacillus cereus]PEZ87951.1 hypothetical protein CN376_23000 [Bacillus cereus]PFR12603.1 hypothetical protein COK30_13725 [Bacillus cereus]